jgi:putative transposase
MLKEVAKKTGASLSSLAQRFSIPRRSLYYVSRKDPEWLVNLIQKLALEHPAWGYRMITAELHRLGYPVNHKSVYRIYRKLGLQRLVTRRIGKKRRKPRPFDPEKALYPGHIWAVDFIHDRLTSGKAFRIFNILDLFSRRAFKPFLDFSLPGLRIAEHFESLCRKFGPPEILRRDDGPEFRSREFQEVLRKWRIREEVIPPGQPYDNGHMESFHGTMREEVLDREEFDTLEEAKSRIENWIKEYNEKRPHSALNYRTPMEIWKENKGDLPGGVQKEGQV